MKLRLLIVACLMASLTAQLHVIGSDKDQSKIVSISIPDIRLDQVLRKAYGQLPVFLFRHRFPR